jgi:hypothetical protein
MAWLLILLKVAVLPVPEGTTPVSQLDPTDQLAVKLLNVAMTIHIIVELTVEDDGRSLLFRSRHCKPYRSGFFQSGQPRHCQQHVPSKQ